MTEQQNNWPAARFVHLVGGCHAINETCPSVRLGPKSLNGNLLQFQLPRYSALYGELYSKFKTLELPIIGVDFYSHVSEIDGRTPPEWRHFYKSGKSVFFCEDVIQIWAGISHNAHKKREGRLWDLTSRIKHQLRVCSWRLRQISISYSEQLTAQLKTNAFEVGKQFIDGFTWLAYLSIQAFLVDACVLRDYLAEFTNYFVLGPKYNLTQKISSMSGLKKNVLNKIQASEPIIDYLNASVRDDGWIKILGDYRDLIVHSAPLAMAQQNLFAVCRSLSFNGSEEIPAIACPIPDNPAEILSSRARGDYLSDFDDQIKAFWEAAGGLIPSKDGLEYAHLVIANLSVFSNLLAKESPLPPEMMVFDKTNIIGPITTN